MEHLSERDLHAGLQLLRTASAAGSDTQSFARACIAALPALVASEITTLSICDLRSGRRTVIGSPDNCLSAQDSACFDRHFDSHPLVRFHAHQAGQGAIASAIQFRSNGFARRRCTTSTTGASASITRWRCRSRLTQTPWSAWY